MTNNLFVGGFPYETTQEELARFFRACGTVKSCKILMDRETSRSRGIGFVEMSTEAEARAAIAKLNGAAMGSRTIFVSEARPSEKGEQGSAAKPGFVERRSGKDRRARGASTGEARREAPFERKKSWGEKKPWGDKKPSGEKKKWSDKPKKWGPGGPGPGGNKWGGGKPRKFGGRGR